MTAYVLITLKEVAEAGADVPVPPPTPTKRRSENASDEVL